MRKKDRPRFLIHGEESLGDAQLQFRGTVIPREGVKVERSILREHFAGSALQPIGGNEKFFVDER